MRKSVTMVVILMLVLMLSACGNAEEKKDASLTKVSVMLDWTPNTNHTGLYVARDKGYYEEAGLDVEIRGSGETAVEQSVAAGNVDFGVSYQEQMTLARVAGIPLVSIAAVIQHNTSGFASLKEKDITTAQDFEGKIYGGWGSESEKAVIQSVMEAAGADYSKLEQLDTGFTDFFTAVKTDIDIAWIFYGWDGIQAELKDVPINMIYVKDLSDQLDYYTPVLITSEKKINEERDIVEKFMAATSKGYNFAIDNPEEAAGILLAAEPDLDEELVLASQAWLSQQYQADADRWGEQSLSVWENYGNWMYDHQLLEHPLEAEKAFTNEFLPNE